MWIASKPVRHICDRLKRSRGAIVGQARRLNLGQHANAPRDLARFRIPQSQLDGLNVIRRGLIKEVWRQGGTIRDAAERLGLNYTYTCRLASRFGIRFREQPYKQQRTAKPSIRNKDLIAYDESRREHSFSLIDLPVRRCKWPLDGDGPIRFCGAPLGPHVKACGPYCETHQYYATHPERRYLLFEERPAA